MCIRDRAYSMWLQANLIGGALADEFLVHVHRWPGVPFMQADAYIFISNADWVREEHLARVRAKKYILYLVIEGPFYNPKLKDIAAKYNAYVVSPSKYAASKIEESTKLRVDEVVPHGIAYLPPDSPPGKAYDFLYVGEYQSRKLPPWGLMAAYLLRDRLTLVSSPNVEDVRRLGVRELWANVKAGIVLGYRGATDSVLRRLYATHRFYLNLSANEGFGITPLEAMAFWEIPIIPDIPVFRETIPDCAYRVPIDGSTKYFWRFGNIMIEMFYYSPFKMYDVANSARWDEARARECAAHARKYYYKDCLLYTSPSPRDS